MTSYLDFEKPIAEIEGKLQELRHLSDDSGVNMLDEVSRLEGKVDRLLRQTYSRLTPWQKTQVARHQLRPHCSDYILRLVTDFLPLAGDRVFGEDRAVIGGLGRFCGHTTMVIGQEKGADTEGRVAHNFGMANPEGYRKAARLLRLAERFQVPVLTLIDTPGAHPGVGGGGARSGRGHRALHRDQPRCQGAGGCADHRRRRLRRSDCARCGQPRADDGACGLLGDLP